jgi:uncharacterized protein YcbX
MEGEMSETIEGPGMLLPEIDDATRREFLIGAAGLLVFAPYGCGNGGQSDGPSGETRTVRHALGETKVPPRPGRIVAVTGQMDLDALLALGLQPVAAGANFENDTGVNPWSQDRLDDVEVFKFRPEVNVEQVATFEPDLIIGHEGWMGPVYDQLREVAPTVVVPYDGGVEGEDAMWREPLRIVARAVGREERWMLSRELAREVSLRAASAKMPTFAYEYERSNTGFGDREGPITEERMPVGTFFDEAPVHLVSTATLDELRTQHPRGDFRAQRFRPNVVLDLDGCNRGFEEENWIGRVLLLGNEVRLRVTGPCSRCVMVNLPQEGLRRDLSVLRTIAKRNGGRAGVYATVLRGDRSAPATRRSSLRVSFVLTGSYRRGSHAFSGGVLRAPPPIKPRIYAGRATAPPRRPRGSGGSRPGPPSGSPAP